MDLEEDLVSDEDLTAILDNFNTKKTYTLSIILMSHNSDYTVF